MLFFFIIKVWITTGLLGLFFLFFSQVYSQKTVYAQQGCCSWHGGISYCDYSTGRYVCIDGSYSPTCTCGYPSYTPQPSCPLFSSYNSLTQSCECYSGYVTSGNQCISNDQYCRNLYGYNSRYNILKDTCECSYGYVFDSSSNSCKSGDQVCWDKYGYQSEYNNLDNACECSYGYVFNSSGNECISEDEACKEQFGYGAKAALSGDTCECKYGYIWEGNRCVWDISTYDEISTGQTSNLDYSPQVQTPVPAYTPQPAESSEPVVVGQATEVPIQPPVKTGAPTPTPTQQTAGGKVISYIVLLSVIGLPLWIILKYIRRSNL